MSKPTEKEIQVIANLFYTQVYLVAKQIDPDDNEDWHSLCIGWLVGRGYVLDYVNEIACDLRYKYEYGPKKI